MRVYYQENGVTIYHGDCREVMPQVAKADLIVTDPPYGVNLDYGNGANDTFEYWQALMRDVIPMMVNRARAVMFSTSKLEAEQWLWAHFPPKWRLCWYKGALSTRCAVGFKDWEPIFVYGAMLRQMHDHFHVPPEKHGTGGHPCPKPLAWATHLIDKGSKPTHSVMDPFMGSGTTVLAAKQLGREVTGIEVDERFCELAVRRVTGELP